MAKCDGVVSFFGCMSLIPGFTEHVVDKLAFFPPKPPRYHIDDDSNLRVQCDFEPDGEGPLMELPDFSTEGIQVDPVIMQTSRGSTIYGVHFRHLDASKTVLFSHGNSADCGSSFLPCLQLCRQLRVNVLVYDYTGYGLSSGKPSEKDLYADIDAALNYLTQERGEPLDSIVCYGQSLGSVPSVDLVSRCCVGGAILHSALASGLRCISENLQTTPSFDIFKNVVKIADVQCPVFIIHGGQDLEVPIEHGRALHEACPPRFAKEPWWVQEAGHHDIETQYRTTYLKKLQLFMRSLAPVEQDGGNEFNVVLNKTTGRKLGANVNIYGDTVEIKEVTGDLFQQWNQKHPELAVKRGDRISEVNGMEKWWTQNKKLELVVRRRGQENSEAKPST